ncbi:MAG: selenoprotein B glycine/betaine/sarcosine/D-proline reductase [bacterium]|nr:MAG: selenoprotein B glycine/betaine/sarcosine/D-proline reductase [bacterium]
MARLEDLPEQLREYLLTLALPSFPVTPWVRGPALARSRLAVVSTAGIHTSGDLPFFRGAADFRVLRLETPIRDLVMSHVSKSFDRTGFKQDPNVVFPLDRLRDMVKAGEVGSLAREHYSFMGATDPAAMEPSARKAAGLMHRDGVTSVFLVPV